MGTPPYDNLNRDCVGYSPSVYVAGTAPACDAAGRFHWRPAERRRARTQISRLLRPGSRICRAPLPERLSRHLVVRSGDDIVPTDPPPPTSAGARSRTLMVEQHGSLAAVVRGRDEGSSRPRGRPSSVIPARRVSPHDTPLASVFAFILIRAAAAVSRGTVLSAGLGPSNGRRLRSSACGTIRSPSPRPRLSDRAGDPG